jgi:hypothetical protein
MFCKNLLHDAVLAHHLVECPAHVLALPAHFAIVHHHDRPVGRGVVNHYAVRGRGYCATDNVDPLGVGDRRFSFAISLPRWRSLKGGHEIISAPLESGGAGRHYIARHPHFVAPERTPPGDQ